MIKGAILQDFAVTSQEAEQITEDALNCYREWARNKAAQSAFDVSSEEVRALLADAAQRSRRN